MKVRIARRATAFVVTLMMCVSLMTSAFAVDIQPRAEVCPSCGKGTLKVTIEYDKWVRTNNGGSPGKLCEHRHTNYMDFYVRREILKHYTCPCGLDAVYGTNTYQEGFECGYDGKIYIKDW